MSGRVVRRAALLALVLVCGPLLGACTESGALVGAMRVLRSPVQVGLRPGWAEVPPDPSQLRTCADAARTAGHAEVADVLAFYADSAEANADVVYAVVTAGEAAYLVVQRHTDRDEPLGAHVARLVTEANGQGAKETAGQATLHGTPAWKVTNGATPAGFDSATYWLDTTTGRYSVDILGQDTDVQALVDAVHF